MKKVHRENLLIEGENIVVLDYSQMTPKILYEKLWFCHLKWKIVTI